MASLNIPYSFTNNTVANATQVNDNFLAVKNFVESSVVQSDGSVQITTAGIVDSAITTAKIADGAVTSAKILNGTIVDADINASAAIALSKLGSGTATISITGNAATATNVPYSGLTGTTPTWNQSTTGNASTATYATSAGSASSASSATSATNASNVPVAGVSGFKFGYYNGTFASGIVSIAHNLGVVPTAQVVTNNSTNGYMIVTTGHDATYLTVRLYLGSTMQTGSGNVEFSWFVAA